MARIWHAGGAKGPVLGFALPSRTAVDERFQALVAAGYPGRHAPTDAFWGARHAIVQDPDGNDVGLMSSPEPERRFTPGR